MKYFVKTARLRRAVLRKRFDLTREFQSLEESCVPSYIHSNTIAALVAWMRLGRAEKLYRRYAAPGPILDFGAATGEIFHMIQNKNEIEYHFIESNDILATALYSEVPQAVRETTVSHGAYSAIFALDSLEHNDDYAVLIRALADGLKQKGVLILSGPTESWIYRLGRRIAGFSGHYHKATIYDIERAATLLFGSPLAISSLPLPGISLFRITVWGHR